MVGSVEWSRRRGRSRLDTIPIFRKWRCDHGGGRNWKSTSFGGFKGVAKMNLLRQERERQNARRERAEKVAQEVKRWANLSLPGLPAAFVVLWSRLILFIHLRIPGFGISHQQSSQPFSTSDTLPPFQSSSLRVFTKTHLFFSCAPPTRAFSAFSLRSKLLLRLCEPCRHVWFRFRCLQLLWGRRRCPWWLRWCRPKPDFGGPFWMWLDQQQEWAKDVASWRLERDLTWNKSSEAVLLERRSYDFLPPLKILKYSFSPLQRLQKSTGTSRRCKHSGIVRWHRGRHFTLIDHW